MKAKLSAVLVVAAAIGLLCAAPTQAAGDSIIVLGWSLERGDFVIDSTLVDQGESCTQAEVGGGPGNEYWSNATKPIGPHLLSTEEPLVLEYVVMLPGTNWDKEHNVSISVRNAASTNWRWHLQVHIPPGGSPDFRMGMG